MAIESAPPPQPEESTALTSRQRILLTVDPLGQLGSSLATTLSPQRTIALTRVYLGLEQIQNHLQLITDALNVQMLPSTLIGQLQQPDGKAPGILQVTFDPSELQSNATPVTVQTDTSGTFQLTMPPNLQLPNTGISLIVHGANGNTKVQIPVDRIAKNGLIGIVQLPQQLEPLPISILAALNNLIPPMASTTRPPQPADPPHLPVVKLGEDSNYLTAFSASNTVEAFPYGIFFRIVEPRMSIVNQAHRIPQQDEGKFSILPIYATEISKDGQPMAALRFPATLSALNTPPAGEATTLAGPIIPASDGDSIYIDRVPVEQPLSVDGFRDQIMGLTPYGIFTADETVPMAATLGLGYVLWMSQSWYFKGVGLGDLVYSLPLAPGEQQQVAVFERVDTASVRESEFFTEQQAQTEIALSDTSTAATFQSAFNETVNAGSSFQAFSATASYGFSLLIASGGGGATYSTGNSNEWLQGQRNTTQQAAESTHSAAERQASARKSASRTSMRLATASESESVTTKVITNHNHTRALTMQYWQVLRQYDVTTSIAGLSLTCLVPLQLVRFLPQGQPLLISKTTLGNREDALRRYRSIIKHSDVLAQALPRKFQYGLTLLQQFASDPTADVEPLGGTAEDVIKFSLTGTFLYCEDVYISAVTKRNTRVGPVKLTNTAINVVDNSKFISGDDLMAALSRQRQAPAPIAFTGNLALPPSMNRSDIIGFEISRSFHQINYTLYPEEVGFLIAVADLPISDNNKNQVIQSSLGRDSSGRTTIHLAPVDLERALHGPSLFDFSATIVEFDASGPANQPVKQGERYANDSLNGVELPPQPYPVPALQIGPVLRYSEILEIERMVQHVTRNTLEYSKAVWASMTADERAVLLDGYTIGVPTNGISDPSQMVPLLNCVENRLLGFFGNSMILPFMIPKAVADSMHLDTVQIQQSLLAYQQATFSSPQSTITLPTRGVLGEAVLGNSPSAEKIDLTRFWNWSDSAGDTAPAIAPTSLPTAASSIATGITAPNTLTNLPSLINNVLNAPSPDTSLLQALSKAAASQQDFSPTFTGADQLKSLIAGAQTTANSARADALKTTKDLQSQAMATVGNIVGGIYGGNPNAGSNAAAAVNGKGGQQPSGSTSGPKTTTPNTKKQTNPPSTSGQQDGSTPSAPDGGSDSGTILV